MAERCSATEHCPFLPQSFQARPSFCSLTSHLQEIQEKKKPAHSFSRGKEHYPSKMNLQEYLIVKESFLQAVSSVTTSYTIYINRSCAPLLNLYYGLKTKCVKTCSNKISEALSTLASLPVSLFRLHQAGGKMCALLTLSVFSLK